MHYLLKERASMLLADLDQNRLDDAAAVADAAIAHFGHGGMLVNNAGLMSFKPIEE